MAFDIWLEQDIKNFLDTEVSQEVTPVVTRLEDSASMYANHDWKKEIAARLKDGDAAGAKQLFAQLRLKYLGTPKTHEEERAQLYKLMQEAYIVIANNVLGDWHTKEILRRMESGPENIFDSNVKPVDLSAPQERIHESLPELPQLSAGSADQFGALTALKESNELALPERDSDSFSFEPDALMRAAASSVVASKQGEKASAPRAPQRPAPAPVRAAMPTPAQVTPPPTIRPSSDSPFSPMPSPKPVLSEPVSFPRAPVAQPPAQPVPVQPQKTVEPPHDDVTASERLHVAMAIAAKDPKRANALLEPLTAANVQPDIRAAASRLLEALKPHVTSTVSIDEKSLTHELTPRERALASAKATANAYQRTAHVVDQALGMVTAFARARKRVEAERALADAKEQIDALALTYPSAAALLRERFANTERLLAIITSGPKPAAPETSAPEETDMAVVQESIITFALAARKAAAAKDAHAFYNALASLERLGRRLPESQRHLIQGAVETLRLRARGGV